MLSETLKKGLSKIERGRMVPTLKTSAIRISVGSVAIEEWLLRRARAVAREPVR